jgi:hypothetical protein
MPLVECAPETLELLRELFEVELCHRRAFIFGNFELSDRQRCTLRLRHPLGASFELEAEAVYLKKDEPSGVGLELVGLDAPALDALTRFVAAPSRTGDPSQPEIAPVNPEVKSAPFDRGTRDASCSSECPSEVARAVARAGPEPVAASLYDRIRALSLRQRDGVARSGQLAERVALERTYGGQVWEALLQNPQLSLPEVARIAKNGTLPQPLVSTLVMNAAWLQSAEVRRALLGNPRVSGVYLDRVLKATSRAELKQVVQASAYRSQVRLAAKKLLGE